MLYAVTARPLAASQSLGHHHHPQHQHQQHQHHHQHQHQHQHEPEPPAPVQVDLQRSPSQMWGLRLQGGADYRTQLTIMRVESSSPAYGKLHSGDAIQSVNGQKTRQLRHAEASSIIKESGTALTLIVIKQPGAADSLDHIRPQGKPKFNAPPKK